MCGRYALTTPADVLAKLFKATVAPDGGAEMVARYNVAPTQTAPIVRQRRSVDERTIEMLHWGLVPFWSDGPDHGARMINARSETAAEKPAYRQAMRRRRCLVPADGFFEWRKLGGRRKQPYFIHQADCQVLAFAGLWEQWRGAGDEVLRSFTILTTAANDDVASLHDRMPVIVPPEGFDRWLDPGVEDPETLRPLLRPAPRDAVTVYPVSSRVNKPDNDDASLLEPVEAERPGEPGGESPDDEQMSLF